MKMSRIITMAVVIAFATVSLAAAGTQVYKNQSATVSAKIENNGSRSVPAAVKLTGYDDAGNVIGHLCQEAWLSSYRSTNLDFTWQAPSYATGVYWSSKVEKYGSCGTTTSDDDEHDEHDDYEHDDDDYAETDHH